MSNYRSYGPTGSFGGNGVKLPENRNVPKGSPFFYGKQESLLNTPDNPTRVTYMNYNLPSPYQYPNLNYGNGPDILNIVQEVVDAPDKGALMKDPVLREPTRNNPFMNVMPLDYDTTQVFADYDRYEKSTYPSKKELEVREGVKNQFEHGLIQNSDSLFWNRLNSQRQFVSQPVGSVPSDQGEFGQWLYGNKNVCKQSSVFVGYGVKYTDDSLLCNGVNSAEPTNMGLLNGNLMSSVYGYGS